jgi:hypothetical protein
MQRRRDHPPPPSREDALRRSDLNLAAYVRHAAGHAPGGTVEERDGLLLFAGSHPNPQPHVNGALRLDPGLSAREVVERARAFFDSRNRGHALWARDHADRDIDALARESGFAWRPPAEGLPGIYIDRPLPLADVPGVEFRRVTTYGEACDYLACVGEAWGMAGSPPELVWAMFLTPEAVLAPQVAAFVAYADGRPLAGSMAYVAHEVAGLYWMGTTAAGKGRGLGASCLIASLEAGFHLGATMACGQASMKGTPVLVSIGFEVITHYRRYFVPPRRLGQRAEPVSSPSGSAQQGG